MLDPFWRDVAAIWGAVLSTIIVLVRLIPSRPRFEVGPGQPPISDLTLRIVNPDKEMRLVREIFRIKISGDGQVIGVYTEKSKLSDAGVPGTLSMLIRGEDEKEVTINCLATGDQNRIGRWILCFLWRGNWILPVSIPAFVYISTKRATRLNTAI